MAEAPWRRKGGPGVSPPPGGLTERQEDALLMVRLLTAWRGRRPSLRELADALLVSVRSVQVQLRALRAKGLVTWEPHRARTLRALT
jgi:Mn-dependent DtxR family transcriptional regulator